MKKIISLFMILAMCMSFTPAFAFDTSVAPQKDYKQTFWDVSKDHWAFSYIGELVDKGVLAGYEDGSFRPENTVTRAEWAKIMVLAAGLPVTDNNVYFRDMSGHWANMYVNAAKDYLAAYTDNTYRPDQAAVREDVTVSMVKLKGYDIGNVDYSYLNSFSDTNSISNSLKAYVAVAVEKGLIDGFEDGTFRGQNTLTRAEAAALLWRAFQYGSDNKVADSSDPASAVTASPSSPSTTKQPQATPKATSKPQNTPKPSSSPVQAIKPEEEKPYVIDTLAQADLKYDFTYDGDLIYYIEGNDIYSLDPYSGDTDVIYDTSDLILEKTKLQEKEVTKTVSVPKEDEGTDAQETEKPTDPEEDTAEDETSSGEETVNSEDAQEFVTEEVTETVTEEVVDERYSDYVPTQVIYDEYNDRLIMTGYFRSKEKLFETPQNDIKYYVAYDISNDEVFWEFGRVNYTPEFKCFLSTDKAILEYEPEYGVHDYIVNTVSQKEIDYIRNPGINNDANRYISIKNDIYGIDYGYYDRTWSDYILKYDFTSDSFNNIFRFPNEYCCIGLNGIDLYYWDTDTKKIWKLDLSSGQTSELSINTTDEDCDVLDMTSINSSNIWDELIPISDSMFVFYDDAANAFRTISES